MVIHGTAVQPRPLFGGPDSVILNSSRFQSSYFCVTEYLRAFPSVLKVEKDHAFASRFLGCHNNKMGTFNNYRGLVERLMLWSWIHCEKSVLRLNRRDFEKYIEFNQNPPLNWVGVSPRPRFISRNDQYFYGDDWRPMTSETFSANHDDHGYTSSPGTIRQIISISSSFYNYLFSIGVCDANPVVAIRPQGYRTHKSNRPSITRLTEVEFYRVLQVATKRTAMCYEGERALFVLAATYYLGLRISDLADTENKNVKMSDFYEQHDKWFFVVKEGMVPVEAVEVPSELLSYLVRYRESRGLPALPLADEDLALLETVFGRPGLQVRQIRQDMKSIFKATAREMAKEGKSEIECKSLLNASHRWIRDTGAKMNSDKMNPELLSRHLRLTGVGYTFDRFYRADD